MKKKRQKVEVVEAIFGKHPYVSTITLKATETNINDTWLKEL